MAERAPMGRTPLFETVRHPILDGISPRAILKFIDERDRYVAAIDARNEDPDVNMQPMSLKASIPISRLRNMCYMHLVPAANPEEVTEQMLEEFLQQYGVRSEREPESTVVSRIIKDVRMDPRESDPKGRILDLIDKYLEKLRLNGYEEFPQRYPEAAISHIQQTLRPKELQLRLEEDFLIDKNLKKRDFREYVAKVTERAVMVEAFINLHANAEKRE